MDTIDVTIEWDDGDRDADIPVTPVGENRFRIEDDPWNCVLDLPEDRKRRPRVKDVIEARVLEPGRLRFIRVVERARLKRASYIIGREIIDSPHFERALQKVMDLGGHWVRVAGGHLTIHLPRDCDYDFWADYERMRGKD